MSHFRHFVAIDWSGAVGERLAGIAVAICDHSGGASRLVLPGHRWSREEVLDWLLYELPEDSLVGLDLGISLPFMDHGAFFPGWEQSPPDARSLWAMIDDICGQDPHLGATSFVNHPIASQYFRRHGKQEGPHFGGGRGRFRQTELAQARRGCLPYSNFNLVGAAQVGKSSLTGMRMLNRLQGHLPIWPLDPLPASGSVIAEIYTSLAAIEAGRRPGKTKMRSAEELNVALASLGSPSVPEALPLSDHASDALLTSAWLRSAATRANLWAPRGLELAGQTEGWTFGAF